MGKHMSSIHPPCLPCSLSIPEHSLWQNPGDLYPWGYRFHSFPEILQCVYFLCSRHMSWTEKNVRKYLIRSWDISQGKVAWFEYLPMFSGGSGSVLLLRWEFPQFLHILLWSLALAWGHCTGPSSLVDCLRASSSKCLRKEYYSRDIQNNIFFFLSFQTPVLRKVLPMLQKCPFCALCFYITKQVFETTICNWPVQCHTIGTNGFCEITYMQYLLDVLTFLFSALLLFFLWLDRGVHAGHMKTSRQWGK